MKETPASPPSSKTRIGIVGGGQLAALCLEASRTLPEIEISLLCDGDDEATRQHADRCIALQTERNLIATWAARQDVITFEHEHIDVAVFKALPPDCGTCAPALECVAIAQDRQIEKKTFEKLNIPVAPWMPLQRDVTSSELVPYLPGIAKTATHGYDGKGQSSIDVPDDIKNLFAACVSGTPATRRYVLEKRLKFTREVSQISVRARDGTMQHYPLAVNTHRAGILSRTEVNPAPGIDPALSSKARYYAELLARHLNYVGIFAIEFFVCEGALIANEWAPRVHNSGHWSIEGAGTSQFENHLRAVAGLALGSCDPQGSSTMWNVIGVDEQTMRAAIEPVCAQHPHTAIHVHWYGKTARPGRKVGHMTVLEAINSPVNQRLAELAAQPASQLQRL